MAVINEAGTTEDANSW